MSNLMESMQSGGTAPGRPNTSVNFTEVNGEAAKKRQSVLNNKETASAHWAEANGEAVDNVAAAVGMSAITLCSPEPISNQELHLALHDLISVLVATSYYLTENDYSSLEGTPLDRRASGFGHDMQGEIECAIDQLLYKATNMQQLVDLSLWVHEDLKAAALRYATHSAGPAAK